MVAHEQFGPHRGFEFGDAARNRRLRYAEVPRRLGQVAGFSRGHDIAQLAQRELHRKILSREAENSILSIWLRCGKLSHQSEAAMIRTGEQYRAGLRDD